MTQVTLDGKIVPSVDHPRLEDFNSENQPDEEKRNPDPSPIPPPPQGSGQMYALYGNVALRRSRCPECGGMALVQEGLTACCDARIDFETSRSKRMSIARYVRKGPNAQRKREILALQKDCCFYCGRRLNDSVYRGFKLIGLRTHFDHVVAFAYNQNNYPDNFVAACHICNGMKGSKMFETVDEARTYIRQRWEKKGYTDELEPITNP